MGSFCISLFTDATNENGMVDIEWEVPLYETPYTPATYSSPAEGGVEVEGDPRPVEINFYPHRGETVSLRIEEGSVLEGVVLDKYPPPLEEDIFEMAASILNLRDEGLREASNI